MATGRNPQPDKASDLQQSDQQILEHLRADGFSEEQLARVCAPIGLDLGGREPAISRQLRAHVEAISGLLAGRLAEAQRAGEIATALPPDELAAWLLLGLYSLAVMVKIVPDRAQLEAAAAIMLSVLDHS